MTFNGFNNQDFEVFHIQGLEPRMDKLKQTISPKLEEIGKFFTPHLSTLLQEEIYVHVAKHARRTTNPPTDTWVAWSTSKRGYKPHPHFQVGLWSTHLFVWFALIYEAPNKRQFAEQLEKHIDEVFDKIPTHFVWSIDHTKPVVIPHEELNKEQLLNMIDKLKKVKKAEILCGIKIDRNDPILENKEALLDTIGSTFEALTPLYRLAVEKE